MGRKRKDFSDKFKLEVAKEALKKRAKEAPMYICRLKELPVNSRCREENERLRAKQDEMLASLGKKQLEVDLLKKKLHLD